MPNIFTKLKNTFRGKAPRRQEPIYDMLGDGLQDTLGDTLSSGGEDQIVPSKPKVNPNSLTIGGVDLGLGGDGSLDIGGKVSPPKPKRSKKGKKPNKMEVNPNSMTIGGVDFGLGDDGSLDIGGTKTPPKQKSGLGRRKGARGRRGGQLDDSLLEGIDPFLLGGLDDSLGVEPSSREGETETGGGKTRMLDEDVLEWKLDPDDVKESAHDVRRVDYKSEIGDTGTNKGFFKPYSKEFHGSPMGQLTGVGRYDKDDSVKKESKLIARSVASTRLDQKLGQDTVSHEFEAKHDGMEGVVSGKVEGQAISDQPDLDLRNPETQKGLSNLQFFDYLTNQQDRHDGNIYVDPETGKVKGIDNDISWGDKNTHIESGKGQNNSGLPTHIDRGMYESFSKLSKKDFIKTMSGKKGDKQRLGKKEKKAAKERYDTMKRYLSGEEVDGKTAKIVDEWNDETYNEHEQAFPRHNSGPGTNYKFMTSMMHVPTLLGRQIAVKQTRGKA